MISKPLISVVIPTYNRGDATVAAIDSALAQTWRPLQIVVVDDGSTDGSSERIERHLSNLLMPGIEIVLAPQPNQGPSGARNTGIAHATGSYIAFLDSDDTWLPQKLERQWGVLIRFPECGACVTDARYLTNKGFDDSAYRLHGRSYSSAEGIEHNAQRLLAHAFPGFFLSTLLVSTDLVRRAGGFDPQIPFAEDRDLCFRLSLLTSFAYINEMLIDTDRSSTPAGSDCRPWDKIEVRLAGHQRMYEKWLTMAASMPSEIRRIVRRALQTTHCQWANWHLEHKRFAPARQAVSHAIQCGISPRMTAKWALTWTAPALAARVSGKSSPYL
jgi:glycosyltransferase involved in cell wall biosynthesis